MKIVKFNFTSVTCYIPPSYLIPFADGPLDFSISSNGLDFSTPVAFTYLKQVLVTAVFPPFVKLNMNTQAYL